MSWKRQSGASAVPAQPARGGRICLYCHLAVMAAATQPFRSTRTGMRCRRPARTMWPSPNPAPTPWPGRRLARTPAASPQGRTGIPALAEAERACEIHALPSKRVHRRLSPGSALQRGWPRLAPAMAPARHRWPAAAAQARITTSTICHYARLEFPRAGSFLPPGLDKFSIFRELHDAVVGIAAVSIGNKNIAIRADGHRGRPCQAAQSSLTGYRAGDTPADARRPLPSMACASMLTHTNCPPPRGGKTKRSPAEGSVCTQIPQRP